MSRADALVGAGAAAGYLALSARWGRRADSLERQWFPVVNGDRDLPVLRVPQQLGTPWSLVATSCFLAARGHRVDGLAALAALPVEKGVEVLSKKLLQKQRPVKVLPTRLLDDAPSEGPSFPSGHSAIAAASAYLAACGLPPVVGAALGGGAVVTSVVRVRQGAHWPVDAAAGASLGLAVAAGLRVVVPEVLDVVGGHRGWRARLSS